MRQTKKISFKLVSYTDAAGRYSSEAFRNGNEDNFYVNCDLTGKAVNTSQDETVQLGDYGMVMAVADGMGGANAGEVASQIAVDALSAAFSPKKLSESIVKNMESRQKYLEQIIRDTDRRIKAEAGKDKGKEGMGSTMIIAWLFENELTISWCGDSRAYIFNEKTGIRLVSMDHSYVQELVNKGILSYEQTFDHPQNNIITRSLGDPMKTARPESKTVEVGKDDIILLCSDGLSGVLRDRKTYDSAGHLYPEDNLEDIIRSNTDSMEKCREALWSAAEKGEWYDNVTAILCQITDGPESGWSASVPSGGENACGKKKTHSDIWIVSLILVLIIFVMGFIIVKGIGIGNRRGEPESVVDTTFVGDTLPENGTIPEEEVTSSDEIVVDDAGKDANPADNPLNIKEQTENEATSNTGKLTKIAQKEGGSVQSQNGLTPIRTEHEENIPDEKMQLIKNEPDSLTTNQ
ncbi:MAG: protein phosphatase 2C domain-containing protein [Bacteroidales bacterium]|nr:protein phosphatase 2C domain-containing protein [Bacteroidales bacterium]